MDDDPWHFPHSPAARWCCNRSISPARRAHSSKPAAARLLQCARAGTDRRTDGHRAVHRPCCAHYANSANNCGMQKLKILAIRDCSRTLNSSKKKQKKTRLLKIDGDTCPSTPYLATRVVHRSILCDPVQPNPSAD